MTPPKDQAPGLVARMRLRPHHVRVRPLLEEAADRIEHLEAENAELRGKLERSEAALMRISRNPVSFSHAASEVARAALTEQANIRSPVQIEMAKMVDPRKGEN